MMFKTHFGETVVVVLSIVMGFIMAVSSLIVEGHAINPSSVFRVWSMITMVILLISIFIPFKDWSDKFMITLGIKENTLIHKLAGNILPTLILNTMITLVVSAGNIFYNSSIPETEQFTVWINNVIHDWPITLVVSYFAAFVAEWCGVKVAERFVGKEK